MHNLERHRPSRIALALGSNLILLALLLAPSHAGAQEPDGASERLTQIQDPDGRIFLWPTAFRLDHGERRFEFSPVGGFYTAGIRGVANISGGISFVGAIGATAKVGWDSEYVSLAAYGGGAFVPSRASGAAFSGGAVATIGGREVFVNLAYGVVALVPDPMLAHLASVGVSARVHPRLRLVAHFAAAPRDSETDASFSTAWWLAGFQAWGPHASFTLGAGQFGDLFHDQEYEPYEDDGWPDSFPAAIAQIAHVW